MYYTYLIGWSKHKKYYYGVRYANGCDPKELWVTYFTSSKHVKKFRKENGEPDIIEIRKTFDDVFKARIWESKVLKKMGVVEKNEWLNKTDNISINPTTISDESHRKSVFNRKANNNYKNKKLSLLNKLKTGDKNPSKKKEVREKLSVAKSGSNNPMYGITGEKHPRWNKSGASLGKKWYYNPITGKTKYFIENQQPINFILGRKG